MNYIKGGIDLSYKIVTSVFWAAALTVSTIGAALFYLVMM